MSYQYEHPHPAVTTDIVIFTIDGARLKVLLVNRAHTPYQGHWALPGGFVRMHESLDECAVRELKDKTGIHGVYLEQLYTFGAPQRDPRERIITVAYFALLPIHKIELGSNGSTYLANWFALRQLPNLAFDHQEVIQLAHARLAAKLEYSTIAFQFLPREFTLGELQSVYETILESKVDKRNFRKRVLSLKHVKETGRMRREGAYRPAKLYQITEPDRVHIIK